MAILTVFRFFLGGTTRCGVERAEEDERGRPVAECGVIPRRDLGVLSPREVAAGVAFAGGHEEGIHPAEPKVRLARSQFDMKCFDLSTGDRRILYEQ